MRVLLTGASGFLGLALRERLGERGAEVHCADVAATPDWAAAMLPAPASELSLDVADGAAVRAAVAEVRPDLILHGAAATADAAREAAGDAARVVAVNAGGAANVVEAAAAAGVGRVLSFSSGSVYGKGPEDVAEVDEAGTDPTPVTLYAISKFAGERLALRLGEVHGVEVCTPRIGIVWGRWEHRTDARATTSTLHQALALLRRGREAVLPLEARLPLIEAGDAAEALLRLAATGARGVVNVGPGRLTAVREVAAALDARGAGVRVGSPGNVTLFAAGRPPFATARFEAACGALPETPPGAAAAAVLDWLDAVGDDAAVLGPG